MGGRPIIGITGELDAAAWSNWIREAVVSPVGYTRAVEQAGGAPVVLPPVPSRSVGPLVAAVDGLVFTGGRDVDPELYGQLRHEETDPAERRRDRFEVELMRVALDAGVPLLAIGRGMHVLAVARGGKLTQHVTGHRPTTSRYVPHDVRLSTDTRVGGILGATVSVPAGHHQAPAPGSLGDGITLAGWSPADDVVEAIEAQGHQFAVGVQWHPEEGDDPRLLRALVAAAARTADGAAEDRAPERAPSGASDRRLVAPEPVGMQPADR
jgi:gamma-glutamyl-gamma-aminobutyrate hydrolase PuuD